MRHAGFGSLLVLILLGCAGDDVSVGVRVEIPAEVPSIDAGTLHLILWQYDPFLADASAGLVDHVSADFRHRSGGATVLYLVARGRVDARNRYYLSVDGCVAAETGDISVLWDGLMVERPSRVTMRPRSSPGPCVTSALGGPG